MTDENERMDRAKRIREMREGNRDGDGDADGTEDGGGADEPAESDGGSTDDPEQSEPGPADESAGGDEPEPASPEKQTIEDLVEEATEEAGDGNEAPGETATDGETADVESDPAAESVDVESADTDEEGISAPLPDSDTLEDALADTEETAEPAEGDDGGESAPTAAASEVIDAEETTTEEETRVLEFTLDDENYCLDIEYIEEIVKQETITRVPNTPEFVEGVVDLRGQITTILNPKVTLGKENTEADELIVVFDSEAFEDQGHIGWVVDDVRQVSPIVESEVNDPPMEADYINGVIDRDGEEEFVIWTSPDLALETAE